ncbi:MAG TPA: hypothetical protein VJN18_32525 [Polyangiaceae bacterium]|nr:hypothetical protein [Polyangiaceae bacterium]
MKLTRITITGADDHVDPEALVQLSAEFPFAEWGVLRAGADRLGSPRYPTSSWVQRFDAVVKDTSVNWALHPCGEVSRHVMAGSPIMFAALKAVSAKRVQLNGFSKWRLPMLMLAELLPEVEFILQVQRHDALQNAYHLNREHTNVSILWDASGGRGIDDGWNDVPYPDDTQGPRMGWAGGITPENIVEKIEMVLAENDLPVLRDVPFWLDLESGARTDDRFDMDKVRLILEMAKPFVSEAT